MIKARRYHDGGPMPECCPIHPNLELLHGRCTYCEYTEGPSKDDDETGIYTMLTFVALVLISIFFILKTTQADCKYVWIDEDGEVVRTEVCDNVTDTPALDTPSVAPIRQPNVTPIQPIQPRPLGMRECKSAYVYDKDSGRWLNRGVCV